MSVFSAKECSWRVNNRTAVRQLLLACLCVSSLLGCAQNIVAQSFSVPEHDKRNIWRIETEQNRRGTGFVLSDSKAGFFLVTNKHVLMDTLGIRFFDSVRIYKNVITKHDKVKSSESSLVLSLKRGKEELFVAHENPNVDLVFIQLGKLQIDGEDFTNPKGIEKLTGWTTRTILDTRKSIINDGVRVQVIGYSHSLIQSSQFALSRFGFVASFPRENIRIRIDGELKESQWIVVDATTRGGHSGGPAFVFIPDTKEMRLIGFSQATKTNHELSYVIPSHYILDLLDKVRVMAKD